jgi:hypothetical protein
MRMARLASALGAALVLLLAPALASAEHHEAVADGDGRKPWDQAAMTDLSLQPSDAIRCSRTRNRSAAAPPSAWTKRCAHWSNPPASSTGG